MVRTYFGNYIEDTILIIGAGPTGICTLLCALLKNPRRIIVCEQSPERIQFLQEHYPDILVTTPEHCEEFVRKNSDHGGADVVLEARILSVWLGNVLVPMLL